MNAIEAVKSAPLPEQRAAERDGGVGAGRRGGAESAGDCDRARRVVGQQTTHLPLRDHRLHGGGEEEARMSAHRISQNMPKAKLSASTSSPTRSAARSTARF
jgi:hypothetical protein